MSPPLPSPFPGVWIKTLHSFFPNVFASEESKISEKPYMMASNMKCLLCHSVHSLHIRAIHINLNFFHVTFTGYYWSLVPLLLVEWNSVIGSRKTRSDLPARIQIFWVMTTSPFAGLGEPVSSSRFLQQASSSTNINTLSHYPLQGNSQIAIKPARK